jgi:hypothetical protein
MAKPLAEFTQPEKGKNTTTDVMRISESESSGGFYIQLVKKGRYYPSSTTREHDKVMHFKVDPDDLDDIITVLQYAKMKTTGENSVAENP